MKIFNYINRGKKWQIYHRYEDKERVGHLRKMSESDGFKILKELYQFAYKSGNGRNSNKPDIFRIKTLIKVHSLFNKVKQ